MSGAAIAAIAAIVGAIALTWLLLVILCAAMGSRPGSRTGWDDLLDVLLFAWILDGTGDNDWDCD